MTQFANAFKEGWAGLKSRRMRGMVVESRVVDGEHAEQYSMEHDIGCIDLCL